MKDGCLSAGLFVLDLVYAAFMLLAGLPASFTAIIVSLAVSNTVCVMACVMCCWDAISFSFSFSSYVQLLTVLWKAVFFLSLFLQACHM